MKITKHQKGSNKLIIALVVVIIACISGWGLYLYLNHFNKGKNASLTSEKQDKRTVNSSAEEYVKNGGGSGQGEETAPSAGVVDMGGKNVSTPSDYSGPQSGNLVLYSPTSGQNISNGILVKGASKAPAVYYRISDNVRGVIGSGKLSVDSGYFSGSLTVNTTAAEGSFEVYILDSEGREVDNVSVMVAY